MKALNAAAKKAKKAGMQDMVVIYAQDSNQKMLAQEVARREQMAKKSSETAENFFGRNATSDLAPKPSSRDGPFD